MINLKPIAVVKNNREGLADDFWGGVVSEIILDESIHAEAFDSIDSFSHLEIIFYFHQADKGKTNFTSRHPRGNKNWPKVGIFGQRGKDRPNHLGLCIAKLIKRDGRSIFVKGLDAINGTPVLDIKPVIKQFLPNEDITQPEWCDEIMKDYWKE